MKKVGVKISAAIVAVIVAFFSLVYPTARVGAVANQNSVYYAYYYNGDFAYPYTLEAVPVLTASQSRSVIGADTRVASPDRNGVCRIEASCGKGTGFVIDNHTIATAAHCVSKLNENYRQTSDAILWEILFLDKSGNKTLTIHQDDIDTIHIPYNYFKENSENSDDSFYDYALITVDVDLSDYAMFNLGYPMDSMKNMNATIHCTGFPSTVNNNVNDGLKPKIYDGTGTIKDLNQNYVYYDADTSGGNSGGPVYVETKYDDKIYYSVIGIHVWGYSPGEEPLNRAIRMDTELLNFYKNNPNI